MGKKVGLRTYQHHCKESTAFLAPILLRHSKTPKSITSRPLVLNFIKIGRQTCKLRTQTHWRPSVKHGFHYQIFFHENSTNVQKFSLKKFPYWISQTLDKRSDHWHKATQSRDWLAHTALLLFPYNKRQKKERSNVDVAIVWACASVGFPHYRLSEPNADSFCWTPCICSRSTKATGLFWHYDRPNISPLNPQAVVEKRQLLAASNNY
jgi:hypothetical protein